MNYFYKVIFIKNYLVKTHLIVALAGMCFSIWLQLFVSGKIDFRVAAFVFISVIFFYRHANKGFGHLLSSKISWVYILVIFSMAVLLFQTKTIIIYSCLGLFALLYPKNNFWVGLRNIPGFKVFPIALVWTCVLVFPFFTYDIGDLNLVTAIFTPVFLFIMTLVLPFDIVDLQSDSENLKTFPQLFGVTATKVLGILFLIISCFWIYTTDKTFFYSFLGASVYLATFLLLSNQNRKRIFADFYVEITPIIGLLFYLISRILH